MASLSGATALSLEVVLTSYVLSLYKEMAVYGCHLGRDKTIEKGSSRYYWRNINEEIRNCLALRAVSKNERKISQI